jgi:hypothetical protein
MVTRLFQIIDGEEEKHLLEAVSLDPGVNLSCLSRLLSWNALCLIRSTESGIANDVNEQFSKLLISFR